MKESDRKLAEYAAWLKQSTVQRPRRPWTPIKVDFAPTEGWCLTTMGMDETQAEAQERANRERGT